MSHSTASDLFTDCLRFFSTNLTMLESGTSQEDKWELERRILIAGNLLRTVRDDFLAWQVRVRQSRQPFDSKDQEQYTALFKTMIGIFSDLENRATTMERELDEHVAHSNDLYIWSLEAETLLKQKCVPPAPVQMAFDVTEEEAGELHKLLSAPPDAPGKLNYPTKRVPTTDASALK